jgi:hypothetical protein
MNDLVILGIVLGTIVLVIFLVQEREAGKRAVELKMYQMENTRLIQQMEKHAERRHEENMTYFQGIMQSIARLIRKQEDGEGGAK